MRHLVRQCAWGCLPAADLAAADQCESGSTAEVLGKYKSSCPWQEPQAESLAHVVQANSLRIWVWLF